MKKKIKRTLVCDGGGMKGAFTAGVMDGLKEAGVDYRYFDNYIGTSAGACCAAYFVANQVKEGMRIWNKHILKGYIHWNGIKPRIDSQYLERIMREIEPLKAASLKNRKQNIYVALTNAKTRNTDYIHLNKVPDPISLLMASVTMPSYGNPAMLNGESYYDAGLTAQPPLKFTDELKQDEIWVILNRPRGYRVTTLGWKLLSFGVSNKSLSKMIADKPRKINQILAKIEKRKDLHIICPEKELPVNWLTTDKSKINEAIKIGRLAAKKFIKEYSNVRHG
jgi:predicted patatin/cPLA2 family phospholipase